MLVAGRKNLLSISGSAKFSSLQLYKFSTHTSTCTRSRVCVCTHTLHVVDVESRWLDLDLHPRPRNRRGLLNLVPPSYPPPERTAFIFIFNHVFMNQCVLWPLENQNFSINVLFAVARTTTTRTSKFNSSFMDGLLVYRQSSQNVFCVFRSLYIHYT